MWLRVWVNDETKAIWEIHGSNLNSELHSEMRMMQLAIERTLEALQRRNIIKKFMVLTSQDDYELKHPRENKAPLSIPNYQGKIYKRFTDKPLKKGEAMGTAMLLREKGLHARARPIGESEQDYYVYVA